MSTIRRVTIPVAVALIAAACASSESTTTTTPGSTPPDGSAAPTTDGSTVATTADTTPETPPVQQLAMPERARPDQAPELAGDAVTAFGQELLAATTAAAGPDDNVAVSPLSVAIALGMLEPGATGEAQAQLRELLRIDDPARWHASVNALEQSLESREPDQFDPDDDAGEVHANVANAAFIQPGYPFEADYLDTVGANYGAVIEELDFLGDQASAADRINEFIADATDDHITDLVDETDIDPATVLALVNALLLRASWLSQFDADATVDDDFTRRDGSTVTVPFMHGRSDRSGAGDGWVAATKQLVGRLSVEVVLPDEGRFDDIADRYADVITAYENTARSGGQLVMPNFETRVTTELTGILQAMGLTAPFVEGNLMGIADDPRLVLDKALHETWLAIDEEGIEAAAATVLLVMVTSGPIDEPVPVTLDRPFLFRIVDDVSGATLFSGRIMDPTA